eukprot:TRINITY_DN2323_c0_g1_i4.p1 TRINITY_DN2323_c0_g1~~TRINITY_DN2323_c0_g1_i4.p1  ORF type:complete len:120 (+),score=15.36 TRINITY_DN2323_c0_g1_i4:921-1280(+)
MYHKWLYPSLKWDSGGITSEVNLWAVDHQMFPNFQKVEMFSILLNPGDLLVVPPYWWHATESLTHTISVSFRANGWLDTIEQLPLTMLNLAHDNSLYFPKKCTCHSAKRVKSVGCLIHE